jgi:hypothetical protein
VTFATTLARLREAANQQNSKWQTKVTVELKDLRELLRHFDRLDREVRANYRPPATVTPTL